MPNFFWFFLLFTATAALAYANAQKDRPMLVPLWLLNAGLAIIFEVFIFVFLHSYTYKPEVFSDPFSDSSFGSIFSQLMIVPMIGVTAAFYRLTFPVMLLISFGMSAVEVSFLHLGIYEHHWWKVYYTTLLLPAAFLISSWWYRLLKKNNRPAAKLGLYFMNLSISLTLTWAATVPLTMYLFQPGLFDNPVRDHLAANSVFFSIACVFYTLIVLIRRRVIKLLLFLILLCIHYFLLENGLFSYHTGFASFAALHLFFIAVSCLMWKWTQNAVRSHAG
ncbi:hypothetical protein ACTSEZ_02845 [Metabacillus sp. JX24]|uniref:hypothetical protein n=1 Tax=Metabacillus sp. JX24 TaxID=3240759 RepID=UPI0035107E03